MIVNGFDRLRSHPIDRNHLVIPEILVESYEVLLCDPAKVGIYGGSSPNPAQNYAAIARVLKPVFDCIWNATGYSGSPRFTDSGHWSAQP